MINIKSVNNIILFELYKFLPKKYYKLLELFYKHYSLTEICNILKFNRKELLIQFIYLGKYLMRYELSGIVIPNSLDERYLIGFNDCKKQLLEYKKINRRKCGSYKQGRRTQKKRRNKKSISKRNCY